MDFNTSKEDLSDEEIYFGKVSIKEIKKHIFMGRNRQTISCLPVRREQSHEESLTLIETSSEPSISGVMEFNSPDLRSISSPYLNQDRIKSTDSDGKSDDSFIRLEKMVTELCISPKQDTDPVLDNTLDVVDFILNNVPSKDDNDKCTVSENENILISTCVVTKSDKSELKYTDYIQEDNEIKHDKQVVAKDESTGINSELQIMKCKEPEIKSCSKTPNTKKVNQDHVFKTPKNVLSCKKQSTLSIKKTPGKSNAYQHISSPIASYIKNSPQIPLLQSVHPKKPLPGISSIPKLAKSENKVDNKENFQLPSMAYKSAKKIKLVCAPDKEKLPQGQRVKKLITSLPKPVVIKHDHRQVISTVKPLHSSQEDSFANLTLHQADLSVCTQISAFTKSVGPSGNK